jgi:hypothetical protein
MLFYNADQMRESTVKSVNSVPFVIVMRSYIVVTWC